MSHPSKKASPAWSFSGKRVPPKDLEIPGPASYNYVEKRQISTSGFGSGGRTKLLNNVYTPGPGSYAYERTFDKGPAFSIGMNNQPSDTFKVGGPVGPGRYNPRDVTKECNTSYSFAQRDPRKHIEKIPGPGTYELKSSISSQGIRLGTAQRGRRYDTVVPGPGQYKRNTSLEGPSYGFGSSSKASSIFKRSFTPGPGTYANTSSLRENGSFMTPRRPDISPQLSRGVPGPGTYAEPSVRKSFNGFSLGKAKRAEFCKMDGVPGAGSYTTNQQRPGTSIPFGNSKRPGINPVNHNPGPGSYAIPDKIHEGPDFSMAGKVPIKDLRQVPGPGAYDPQVKEDTQMPNIRFGLSKRENQTPEPVPGPGTYPINSKATEGPGFSFGSEIRVKTKEPEYNSAFYDIPSAVGNVPK